MAESVLVRVVDDSTESYEWLVISENTPNTLPTSQRGALSELAPIADGSPVILLLPATEVLLLEISLPVKTNSQLKKALPFAVEDLLANEVENYHLVWSKQPGDKIAVAAIEQEPLKAWLQRFRKANIKLEGIFPETLFLPSRHDLCSILIDQQRAVVRYGLWRGGGIEPDHLALFLEKTMAENKLLTQVQVWSTEPCMDLSWPKTLAVTSESIPAGLPFLQANRSKKMPLNLLSGAYGAQHQSDGGWKAWLPAVTVVLLAVLMQYGIALTDYWNGKAQLAALETENRQMFKDTFPHLKRIVNIKIQAEQELIALRKKSGAGGDSDYLRLMYQTGEILKQDEILQLQALDFVNGVLNIQVTGTGIGQIENFKQRMEKEYGVKVNIQSAESNEKGLFAHIEIRGKVL